MPDLHVLRVFVNEDGEWGNRLGVFLEGSGVPPEQRQSTAAGLGFSETVFVDDRRYGQLQIYTPTVELPFAGHPLVGAGWLLAREGTPVAQLRPPAGEVGVREADGATFIAARPEWAPPFDCRRHASPAEIHALQASAESKNTYAWAWIDEHAGTVRARSFAPQVGIAEDEATGSAALALCAQLSRPITIHQGHGSVLACRPLDDGRVEVGGAVVIAGVGEHRIDG